MGNVQTQTSATFFSSQHPLGQHNPDLTPPGGLGKKTTGDAVASNRLWSPAATLTGLSSGRQQYPKPTAVRLGKWITTCDLFILNNRKVTPAYTLCTSDCSFRALISKLLVYYSPSRKVFCILSEQTYRRGCGDGNFSAESLFTGC